MCDAIKIFQIWKMDFFAISSFAIIEKMNSSFLLCITYWIFFGSISRQISLLYEHLFYSAFDWELVEPLSYGYHPSTSEAFCWHFCCICSLHIGAFYTIKYSKNCSIAVFSEYCEMCNQKITKGQIISKCLFGVFNFFH